MSKLNICFVTFEFPPFHWLGGEGAYAAGLCDALLKFDNDVTVITTNINIDVSLRTERPSLIFIDTINKSPFRFLSFFRRANSKIKKIQQNKKFDVVHYINSYSSPVISRQDFTLPVVATIHHPYVEERKALMFNPFRKMTFSYARHFLGVLAQDLFARNMCNKATKIISVSKFTAQSIINDYNVMPDKITVIPNAVDTTRFNPNICGKKIRDNWNHASEPLILYVGRLVPTKGLIYLIMAFKNVYRDHNNTKLFVVGEGSQKHELILLTRKLNLENSIKFLGRVPDEELPYLYAAADLVVLPSLLEGFGIVLLEAMAMSKPCIGTNAGGIPEVIVDGETGIVVPVRNSSALYDAICMILEDKLLARKLGEAGRSRVMEKFTWNVVAKKTEDLYGKLLVTSQHAR
jgi:glycosyltransferase involved in cell wall biosynthesis